MPKTCLLVLLLWLPGTWFAQAADVDSLRTDAARIGKQSTLYSGGMLFLQPGWTTAENPERTIRTNSMAIGGILRFYVGSHLTAGIYGGSLKCGYPTDGSDLSYLNLGYGGPLVGWTQVSGKNRFTLSGFAGMGTLRNLHVTAQSGTSLTEADFYRYPVFVWSPLLSYDRSLTAKISLTLQLALLRGRYDGGRDFFSPTLQAGVLFNR